MDGHTHEWRQMRARDCLITTSGSQEIKGSLSETPDDGLYPAYSASGQDVWSKKCDFKRNGIVLSAVGARCGKCFRADGSWTATANTHVLFTNKGFDRDFFWYLLNNEDWWLKGGTAQPFVQVQTTLRQPIFVPDLSHQKSIASHLDHHTSLIDRERDLITKKIALLRDKRKALIFEVVTGKRTIVDAEALAGDGGERLDDVVFAGQWAAVPTAKADDQFVKSGRLVDSGVPWIGEVPEGWTVAAVKFLLSLVSERTSGQSVYIGMENIEAATGAVIDGSDARTSDGGNDGVFKKGQILFGKLRPYLRKVWLATYDGSCSTEFLILNPKDGIDPKFAQQTLLSFEFCQEVNDGCRGVKMPRADWEGVSSIRIPVPGLAQQKEITQFLDYSSNLIEREISMLERKLNLLSEKRKALIFEAVTGKIDLRDTANI